MKPCQDSRVYPYNRCGSYVFENQTVSGLLGPVCIRFNPLVVQTQEHQKPIITPMKSVLLPLIQGFRRWAAFVLVTFGLSLVSCLPASAQQPLGVADKRPNAVAFRQMRHGLFIHDVYRLTCWPDARRSCSLDDFANAFDVPTFADQMAKIGVEYVIFTAWHKSMYLLGPNAALEKSLPGHTAKRDLVGEIADALNSKGIKLIIYAHPNDGNDLPAEEQAKVGYRPWNKADGPPMPVFNHFINEVYGELAARYGKKPNVMGFWWDSWEHDGNRIDAARLRKTVLDRFPGAIILTNFFDGKYFDFASLERGYKAKGPDDVDSLVPERENQSFPCARGWWASGGKGSITLSPESMFRFSLLTVGCGAPGGVCWAVSPMADGKSWTDNGQPLKRLLELNDVIAPLRPTICGVLPSKNWLLPPKTRWSKAPAFVAARTSTGDKEFVHVLKAPEGRFLDLPKPVETFSSARLFASKQKVAMTDVEGKLRLTLPEGVSWSPLDTVIELEITAPKP